MQLIYLDQFEWINLAKAEAGKADGKRFVPVLAAARAAVRDGYACFPISAAHIKETARSNQTRQRKLLARLMTELGQGVVLRTPRRIVEHELKHAVRRVFGLAPFESELSPFGRGVEEGFGYDLASILRDRTPKWVDHVRQTLDTPAAWIDLLTYADEAARRAGVASMSRIGNRFACGRQDDRELLRDSDATEVRRVFASRVAYHFRESLQIALNEVGKSLEDLGSLGPDKLVDFWFGIPCVRTLLELEEALHYEKSKDWKANDLNDLEFLGLAIPACDVVATERFWTHHVKRRGLDREFKTVVLTDLTELRIMPENTKHVHVP